MQYNQIKAAQPDKQAGDFQIYAFSFILFAKPLQFIAVRRLISPSWFFFLAACSFSLIYLF